MKYNSIYCALDTKDVEQALEIGNQIKKYVGGIKVGLEFFTANGPDGIKKLSQLSLPIFLDLKLFDIPNTIENTIESLKNLSIKYLSIHLLNGKETLLRARKTVEQTSIKLLGVSILTSMNQKNINEIGFTKSLENHVEALAKLAVETKIHGIICSPRDIKKIKNICNGMEIVTPGIRTEKVANDDQKRIMTAKEALDEGATILIIGRPITEGDPEQNIKKIINSLN